ncbi:MAG TPA: TonB C-terminal domain-containing protein [Drouetiella sp.]|jgi:TonB C terminal
MKNTHLLMLALSAHLVFAMPSNANEVILENAVLPEDGQTRALRMTYHSRCGPGEPALGMQIFRNLEWKQKLELRLKKQPNYDALLAEYAEITDPFAMVHFEVAKDGTISKTKMKFSSHSQALDKKFLQLIANAGPLDPPANSLPSTLGIDAALGLFTVIDGKKYMYFHIEFGSTDSLSDEELSLVEQTARDQEANIARNRTAASN